MVVSGYKIQAFLGCLVILLAHFHEHGGMDGACSVEEGAPPEIDI